LQAKF